jgi:hypothetical protein
MPGAIRPQHGSLELISAYSDWIVRMKVSSSRFV